MADVWGRGIHHKDGSITESKQDTNTKTLEQITKKNNVALQRRMIMLDQYGRPTEVMIYDGRGTFKYRGVQVYDTFGRFAEEQIYNPNGDLIRRKVQGYTPQGAKMPVRSWDYIDNVPADLRLVITRESESSTDPVGRANANQTKPQEEIYNPNGDLIRRKVQGYTPQGAKMPVRSWDYIDNVPADLRLVITRESESSTDPVGRANANQTKPQEEKRNWFNGNKNNSTPNQPAPDTAEMQPQPLATQQPSYNAAATVPEKRKGLNLGRLFGRKK